ncbi:MAG: hypothetical protein ACOYEV_05825 [Candidatus Nanopelagicales bacterium]
MPANRPARSRAVAAAILLALMTGAGGAHANAAPRVHAGSSPNPGPIAGHLSSSAGSSPIVSEIHRTLLDQSITRLVIGDSLTVSVAGKLSQRGFTVDAKVGRQFAAARAILAARRNAIPANLVLALGTNGPVPVKLCTTIVADAEAKRVFLVTNRVPRAWESGNNRNLRKCAAAFPGRVAVIDWFSESDSRDAYFRSDGYHLSPSGQAAFARMLDAAVDRAAE